MDSEGYEEVKGRKQIPNSVWERKDKRIARMACIKAAADIYGRVLETHMDLSLDDAGLAPAADKVVRMARIFEEYVYED